MRFSWLSPVFALVLLLSVSSCDAPSEGNAVNYEQQSIRLLRSTEPPDLNSTKATDAESFFVQSHIFEGLTRYDKRGNLIGGVAERWQIDTDKATFWLRKNAQWSDGSPVTAFDFVFSWRLVVDPANAAEYASLLFSIANGEAVNKGELPIESLGVRALDEWTLEVDLVRPVGYFASLMAFPTFFPIREQFYRQMDGVYGADADTMLYNGAFALSQWVHGASFTMDKNIRYWNKDTIKLNRIDVPYITSDSNAGLNLFKNNEVSMAGLSSTTLNDALAQRFKLKKFDDGTLYYLEFNFREGRITANRNLRKAIQAAFDVDEFVNKIVAIPGNRAGVSLFPIWLKGVQQSFRSEYPARVVKRDLAQAKAYLELARQELGDIPPLILLVGDSPASGKQAEYFQSLMADSLGLEVKIDQQIFKQRLAKMSAGEFDIVSAGWGPDYNDPMTYGDLFASWNLNNRGRFSHPEYDALVAVAQNSSDPKQRMDVFAKLQEIIIDEVVVLPQYERGSVYVQNKRLRGVVRRVIGGDPDFTYAQVMPDKKSN